MTYLLDVNVLLALGFENHEFHGRVVLWLQTLSAPRLATCSISELGFVRVMSQTPRYASSVTQAKELLLRVKQTPRYTFIFVDDDQDVSRLPAWVKSGKQTTDGHLEQLAISHGAVLATLDVRISGAFLIP